MAVILGGGEQAEGKHRLYTAQLKRLHGSDVGTEASLTRQFSWNFHRSRQSEDAVALL